MLLERGVTLSYETIRKWGIKFGSAYTRQLRRKRASSSDIWYLDEVVIRIRSQRYYLWRAVDQDGYILDETLQKRCNLFVPPHHQRSAIDIHLHRLNGLAQWKLAAMINA